MKILSYCYFPTKTIVIDDDLQVLKGIQKFVDYDTGTYEFFTDSDKALSVVNQLTSVIDGNDDIYNIMLNKGRFGEISTVIVDFQMPSMTGLELCSKIKSPYIRKILYTGIADESKALQAFNAGLIDGYIKKQDQNQLKILSEAINYSQAKYFEKITDVIGERKNILVFSNPEFINFFNSFLNKNGILEYYLNDEIGGFTCLSKSGEVIILYVFTSKMLEDNKLYVYSIKDPKLLRDIDSGRKAVCLPLYGAEAFEVDENNMKKYILSLERVGAFFVAYVKYPGLKDELAITSFEDYLG